jgi:hypothetical protein
LRAPVHKQSRTPATPSHDPLRSRQTTREWRQRRPHLPFQPAAVAVPAGEATSGLARDFSRIPARQPAADHALPFLDSIQKSFGHHDLSDVRAQTGAAAGAAVWERGAEAFTRGSVVTFAHAPGLHTAAHEAAHVIQQRAGVEVVGGVGRDGDAYERHADEVAERVVAKEVSEGGLTGPDQISVAPDVIDNPDENDSITTFIHESMHAGNADIDDDLYLGAGGSSGKWETQPPPSSATP